MHNKKITFILGGLIGGGAEKVASSLIREWINRGYEITLITRLGAEADFFSVPGSVNRVVLGGEGKSANKMIALLKNIPFIWKLRKEIKNAGYPIVVSFLTKTNIHTILAAAGLNKKVIISERNDTTRQSHPWPWPLLRKLLYKYADLVTANSEIAIQGMRGYVPAEKLRLVPNPVSIPEVKASPESSSLILHVGRLVPQKGQHFLLKAFSDLEESLKYRWTCSFLGEGEEVEKLKGLAQNLQISDRVTFHGLVAHPSKYYLKAGIFVLPSEFEGTPNALLEAMSYGLPAIISDSLPGALEYVKDGVNGLVFKSGDSDDLHRKLKFLVQQPELRKKMGDYARDLIADQSVEKVSNIWEKYFIM